MSNSEAAALAEQHSREGVEHYKAGKYPEAVAAMLLAYKAVPDPALLYNIARIYEKLSEPAIAISYYKRFVVAEDADPGRVQKALEHVQRLKSDARKVLSKVADLESVVLQTKTSSSVKQDKFEWDKFEWDKFEWPMGLIGLGVVSTSVGLYFGSSAWGEAVSAADLKADYVHRTAAQLSGSDNAKLADGLFATGGILFFAGVVWQFLASSESGTVQRGQRSTLPINVAPLVSRSFTGDKLHLGLLGRF